MVAGGGSHWDHPLGIDELVVRQAQGESKLRAFLATTGRLSLQGGNEGRTGERCIWSEVGGVEKMKIAVLRGRYTSQGIPDLRKLVPRKPPANEAAHQSLASCRIL